MKYLLLVHHNEKAFDRIREETRKEMLAESIHLCRQLDANDQYIHASPLQPEATGTVVRMQDGKAIVTDGPFMETKEQLAGYFLIHAKDQARGHQHCRTSTRRPDRNSRTQARSRNHRAAKDS